MVQYEKYLQTVVNKNPEHYSDINELLQRFHILDKSNKKIKIRALPNRRQTKRIRQFNKKIRKNKKRSNNNDEQRNNNFTKRIRKCRNEI